MHQCLGSESLIHLLFCENAQKSEIVNMLINDKKFSVLLGETLMSENPDVPVNFFFHPVRTSGEWLLSNLRNDFEVLLSDDAGVHFQSIEDRQAQYLHWSDTLQSKTARMFLLASHVPFDVWGAKKILSSSNVIMSFRDPTEIIMSLMDYIWKQVSSGIDISLFDLPSSIAEGVYVSDKKRAISEMLSSEEFHRRYSFPLTRALGIPGASSLDAIEWSKYLKLVPISPSSVDTRFLKLGIPKHFHPPKKRINTAPSVLRSTMTNKDLELINNEFIGDDLAVFSYLFTLDRLIN